jgi:hypothetical protein
MTAPTLCTVLQVREYIDLNTLSSSSKYTDSTIGSNIRAAGAWMERRTGRIFGNQSATIKKFTTNGKPSLLLPGLRTATTVLLDGTALVADETYWLLPDAQQTGLYTGIQFRAWSRDGGSSWYLGVPDWWDRGLDMSGGQSPGGSLPNDLIITGDWGYVDDATMPEEVRHTAKVLAAYFTKRPDAILGGALATPEGGVVDLSQLPIEVQSFVADWRIEQGVEAVG